MNDIYELIAGVMGIATLIVVVLLYLRDKPTPAQLDAKVTAEIDARRTDRDLIAFWEKAYQETSAANRQLLDTAVSLIKLVAPLTPATSDNSAVKLLEDIQAPGEPTAPQTAEELAARLDPNAQG